MTAGYRPVGYFDPTEWRDAPVCDRCGAVVHPAALEDHDQFHELVQVASDRAWTARMNQGAEGDW